MLDMGFEPQIKKILLDIRPDRQTVMTRYVFSHIWYPQHILKRGNKILFWAALDGCLP